MNVNVGGLIIKMSCIKCLSDKLAWSIMNGIYCQDCKTLQYPNSKEEQKTINKLMKDNVGIGK